MTFPTAKRIVYAVVKRKLKIGRPREFQHPVRLQVFLERAELAAVRRVAKAAGLSQSRFARRALLAAIAAQKEG